MDHNYGNEKHLGFKWWDGNSNTWWTGAPPNTSAPNFYGEAQLCLGLTATTPGECVRCTLVAGSEAAECKWTWPTEGQFQEPATIRLAGEGRELYGGNWPEISIGQRGRIDPLLLPGFLQQQAAPDNNRKTWRVAIRWDLQRLFVGQNLTRDASRIDSLPNAKPEDKVVGTKFIFEMDRPMPEPIVCLEELRD
jgi:hypothetical protein